MIGDERVGRVLARLRDQRDITQARLAKEIGIHPTTLSKYENLGRIPEEVFLRICDALAYAPGFVIAAALELFLQDLQQAELARNGPKKEIPVERQHTLREQRPALTQLGELYDSYAAEQKKLLLGILQYLGPDSQLAWGILPDIGFPKRKKRARRTGIR